MISRQGNAFRWLQASRISGGGQEHSCFAKMDGLNVFNALRREKATISVQFFTSGIMSEKKSNASGYKKL